MQNYYLLNSDYMEICNILETRHSLFYKLWHMGKPVFTDKVPTAAVSFDEVGEFVMFMFNPDYWKKMTNYERAFVIGHEGLHVLLNHGKRLKGLIPEIGNITADVVINETLVNKFGFEREKIHNWKDLCWLDTVFVDKETKQPRTDIEKNANFEYYYNQFMKSNVTFVNTPQLVDGHEGLGGIEKNIDKIFGKLGKSLDRKEKANTPDFKEQQDKETEQKYKEAGLHPGHNAKTVMANYVPKKKWETVIKSWVIANSERDDELWNRRNRRISMLSSNLILPVDKDDDIKKEKIRMWLFQDTSGSCVHLAERFFKAAKSIPKNRFDIRMFCFDTKVYETSLETGKLYGFGGTSFTCIDDFINKWEDKGYKQAHAYFVISDGFADKINPRRPNLWHFFLSENYTECIPADSFTHMLNDFE